jgi:hypothetical protein
MSEQLPSQKDIKKMKISVTIEREKEREPFLNLATENYIIGLLP